MNSPGMLSRVYGKNLLKNRKFEEISLDHIDRTEASSDFSFPAESGALLDSIRGGGLFHPVYLAQSRENRERLFLVSGHRRLRAVERLGWDRIPAFILEDSLLPSESLLFNVEENRVHRAFNDIERSNILHKLAGFGTPEAELIDALMPLLDLERSKKVYRDCLSLQDLIPDFKEYLVRIEAPLRISAALARWKEGDQKAIFQGVQYFNPGANKLREILELIEEIALRDGLSIANIFDAKELRSIFQREDLSPSDKGKKVWECLQKKRFPYLAGKKEAMEEGIKRLTVPKGAALKFPENFEEEALTLHLRFSSPAELQSKMKEIQAKWGEEKIEGIFKLLRE